jgi:ribosomal protein S12 methylthiotransferase
MGCLSERFKTPLQKEIPEVDAYFGVNSMAEIVKNLGAAYRADLIGERVLTTPGHFAYLKIAEGCDRKCSFCAIPGIRGKHISRTPEDIINEAKLLASQGVKELILISQDLTYYGLDLNGTQMLPDLVNQLSDLKLFTWIRLHYLFPNTFPSGLLNVIASRPDVCNYIDIPLQHINDRILKSMRRGIDKAGTIQLIDNFRHQLPGASLRTSFIVGYPGETEEEFNELKQFVREVRFDRVGVFTYSHEEDTQAFKLSDDVPDEIKQQRASELMEIQQEISLELNQAKLNKEYLMIVDREEGDYYIGRTEADSPEVDNEILLKNTTRLKIGEFYTGRIMDADAFDLFAEII